MKTMNIRLSIFVLATLYLCSCTTPPKAEKEVVPKKPETTIQVASINLAHHNKRIERNNVNEFVKILKSEQIEVLAVQGITRYPGLATRVDFVNELVAKIDWRNAFGEMLSVSGKQTGNAVFSVYPILSHQNFPWDNVKSSSFDAALQATVDAGTGSLIVVSTQLPSKATLHEQAQCLKLIAAMNPDTAHRLMIVTGNLPMEEVIRTTNSYAEVPLPESSRNVTSKIWFSLSTSLQLLSSRSVETELGTLVIAQFGIFRQQKH
jgi:hypothetical protein